MNTNMNYTRLTDSLERELIQRAIEEQYEFPALDEVLGKMFHKVAAFFKGPEVTIHQTHTAH